MSTGRVVSLAIVSLLVIFGIVLWRSNAPKRAYDKCMASLTSQLKRRVQTPTAKTTMRRWIVVVA